VARAMIVLAVVILGTGTILLGISHVMLINRIRWLQLRIDALEGVVQP
jgi:hypothetical protein